jgi:hypothetical protein
MKKHHRKLLLALVGLMAFASWLGLVSPLHRIHRAGFDQIREGMTVAEVGAILGRPPGYYATEDLSYPEDRPGVFLLDSTEGRLAESWYSNDGLIIVEIGRDGTIWRKHFVAVTTSCQSISDRFKRWLGR